MIVRSIVLVGCASFVFPRRANAAIRGRKTPEFRKLPGAPTDLCTAGGCVFDTLCRCCNGDAGIDCDAYFKDPSETCGEEAGPITKAKKQKKYKLTNDRNCGWDPAETIENNNANGKWVCAECQNDHQGYDIPEGKDVSACAAICDSSSDCAGFAHFLPGITGADCESHGAKEEGSCYFRQPGWIERGFDKPCVNCFEKKEGKEKPEKKKKGKKGDKL